MTAPLFTKEGPSYYTAAYAHNSRYATGGPYNTVLSGPDETAFRAWVTAHNVPFDVLAATVDYNMRGYWLAVIKPGGSWGGGHFPDGYKTPYDTSFSKESLYATADNPFTWVGERLIDMRTGQIVFWAGYVAPAKKPKLVKKAAAVSSAYARSARGQERSDVPVDYWQKEAPRVEFGRERFRASWVPKSGRPQVIDSNVESIEWDDSTAVLTGQIHTRDPSYGPLPNVTLGDEIMLEVALGGAENFIELWRMRVVEPYREFKGYTRTLDLTNALGWLARSVDDFVYLKDKLHPQGWKADEIVKDVARRYNVPIGVVAECKHHIKRLVLMNSSPLKAIAEAYKRERAYTDRRFVISCDHGKLNVLPLRRNPQLLELGASLIDAGFRKRLQDEFATALTVRATGKTTKGKDRKGHTKTTTKKVVVKVASAVAVKQFGYVHKNVWAHDADTEAEANASGLRHIVRVGQPSYEINLTHPGIPTIRRGDAIRALLPEQALRQVLYVTGVQHSVQAGNYTMTVVVMFTDPFVDAKLDKVDDQKDAVGSLRGRNTTKKVTTPPVDKKAKNRANKETAGDRLAKRGHPR